MANLYYARKVETIYFEAINKREKQQAQSDNLLYIANININELTLKPLDFVNEEITDSNEKIKSYQTNEKITEKFIIQKPDMSIKTDSIRIADAILDEANRFWTSKDKIRKKIKEINTKNVFNFIGYMITISSSRTAIGDIKKYVNSSDVKHIVFCLLIQAKNSGLVNIKQYKKLKNVYSTVASICNTNPFKKLDKSTFVTINAALEEMYEELYKIY